ncbi:MAG TPA: DUF3800 domain-containing protein [Rhodospirillaceae bacterium]|nr:hypothetical protein [Rhodospirillaceae bacterium]MAX63917.1 hypothetical protein [Rhodospirillaceae bacterium]MBB58851.1 hypothetical protein [Rhodospirillaceae bacterium]HAE03047.1 DUF3800 domain-containing protein [Rhodospirillaceae bacterium]HAJ20666.1 DUF3800 domain-containing protein [Rhodospirillaceae bacterium]|tara:strand:+ start:6481 stop:7344 length:864 start_codon:yes stop_codon:yes gene_type:complete
MSWSLFIDESGQDQKSSPYEVLAGIAIKDSQIWPLIQELTKLQIQMFGIPLFSAYGKEAKAQKLLKAKVFKHAAQLPQIDPILRRQLASEVLQDGSAVSKQRLTALAQAKLDYCLKFLIATRQFGGVAFASIVPQSAQRPSTDRLRKDYAYLFERFFSHLNLQRDQPMGYLIFDELEKSASQILLNQVQAYFKETRNGRTRSRLIIPEPFFVHSDLTTLVQMADLIAYVISWGVRLKNMDYPRRPELASFAEEILKLRFTHITDRGYNVYGFKVINDLRALNDRQLE